MSEPDVSDEATRTPVSKLTILGLKFDPHRLIYATIMLIATLSIYGDSDTDRLSTNTMITLIAVLVAPLFALTMAHAFSDALDMQIMRGRRLNAQDRRHLLATNLEYMYVAVPPIALTLALGLAGISGNTVINVILALGIVSLFMWGVFAARKAGLGMWGQVRFGVNYSVMGLIIVIVELILTH